MTWHVAEVWLLLVAFFVSGCVLGSLLHVVLARSPLAGPQEILADSISALFDEMSRRTGMGPAWRHQRGRRASQYDEHLGSEPDPFAAYDIRHAAADGGHPDDLPTAIPAPPSHELLPAPDATTDHDEWIRPDTNWETEGDWDDHAADTPAIDTSEPVTRPSPSTEERPRSADGLPSMRPVGLAAPRNGVPDDLQRIRGIGRKNEELLNGIGIFHFGQIAAWTPAEVRWVAGHLAFPERIERDDWIGQATVLASGGNTGYVKAAHRRNDVGEPSSEDDDPASDAA